MWKGGKTGRKGGKKLLPSVGSHQISANNSTPLRYSKKFGIRLLFGYEYQAESGVITRLELYSNRNFSILIVFVYERWYSSEFESEWYSCFDWTRFWVFNIELRLDLGYRLLRLDSRTNLESVPRFAKIWFTPKPCFSIL